MLHCYRSLQALWEGLSWLSLSKIALQKVSLDQSHTFQERFSLLTRSRDKSREVQCVSVIGSRFILRQSQKAGAPLGNTNFPSTFRRCLGQKATIKSYKYINTYCFLEKWFSILLLFENTVQRGDEELEEEAYRVKYWKSKCEQLEAKLKGLQALDEINEGERTRKRVWNKYHPLSVYVHYVFCTYNYWNVPRSKLKRVLSMFQQRKVPLVLWPR